MPEVADDQVTQDFVAHRAMASQAGAQTAYEQLGQPAEAQAAPAAPAAPGAAEAAVQPPTPPEPPKPIGRRIVDGVWNTARDIGAGTMDAPRQIVGGAADWANNLWKFADDTVKAAEEHGLPNVYFSVDKTGPHMMSRAEYTAAQKSGQIDTFSVPTTGSPESVTGNIVRAATTFLIGRGNLAGKGASLAPNMLASFISGATGGVNPDEKRLSNIVDSFAPNFVSDFLKAKPEDEGTMLSHLKAGLEFAGLDAAFAGIKGAVVNIKNALKGGEPPTSGGAAAGSPPLPGGGAAAETEAATGATSQAAEVPRGTGDAAQGLAGMQDDLPWQPGTTLATETPGQHPVWEAATDVHTPDLLPLGNPEAAPVSVRSTMAMAGQTAQQDLVSVTPEIQEQAQRYLNQEIHGTAPLEAVPGKAISETGTADYSAASGNPVHVNLARINAPDDIKDVIARTSAMLPRTGAITHEETVWAADGLGVTPEQMMEQYATPGSTLPERMADIRAELLASRMIRDSSATQLVVYAKAAATPTATEADQALFARAFATHRAIQAQTEGASSEAGRILESLKILSRSSNSQAEAVSNIINGGGIQDIGTLARAIADADGPLQAGRIVEQTMRTPGQNPIMSWVYNAYLSNPRTVIKKTISDASMALWNLATNYTAEKAGQIGVPGFTGGVQPGETGQLLAGLTGSMGDMLRLGKRALLSGESYFNPNMTLSEGRGQVQLARIMALAKEGAPEVLADDPIAAGFSYINAMKPRSWIGAVDDMATFANLRGYARALSWRAAAEKGLEGPELETAATQMMDNMPTEIAQQAYSEALRSTFKQDLTKVGQLISDTANAITYTVPHTQFEVPLGRMILPFIKVPANIAAWTARNSALGLTYGNSEIWRMIQAGGAQRDLALARVGLGTMVATGAFAAAASGQITGRGPSDPQLNRAWKAAGNDPYSISIGGTKLGFNSVEPIGMMLGAIADTVGIMKFAKEEDGASLATSLVAGTGNAMLSKTYFEGIAGFFDALNSPDTKAAGWGDRLLASLTVPQGIAGLRSAVDPWVRTHYDLMQAIENRLPYVSQGLPPARTLWGDPVPLRDAYMPFLTGTGAARMLSPIPYGHQGEVQPIDTWIFDHRMDFPRGPENKLGLTRPGIVQNFSAGQGLSAQVELTPQLHDRLAVLAGNELKDPATGLGAKDTLNALVEGKYPNENTQAQWDAAPNAVKAMKVQEIVNKFRAAAKKQLVSEDPDLADALDAAWQARAQQLQGATQ